MEDNIGIRERILPNRVFPFFESRKTFESIPIPLACQPPSALLWPDPPDSTDSSSDQRHIYTNLHNQSLSVLGRSGRGNNTSHSLGGRGGTGGWPQLASDYTGTLVPKLITSSALVPLSASLVETGDASWWQWSPDGIWSSSVNRFNTKVQIPSNPSLKTFQEKFASLSNPREIGSGLGRPEQQGRQSSRKKLYHYQSYSSSLNAPPSTEFLHQGQSQPTQRTSICVRLLANIRKLMNIIKLAIPKYALLRDIFIVMEPEEPLLAPPNETPPHSAPTADGQPSMPALYESFGPSYCVRKVSGTVGRTLDETMEYLSHPTIKRRKPSQPN